MTKAERAKISRENGAKSKGPSTPEGKEKSARNSIRRGERTEKLTQFIPPHSSCGLVQEFGGSAIIIPMVLFKTALLFAAVSVVVTAQTYVESDPIPGKTILEKLSHVSQLDLLANTKADAERCSCAAGINAYLLIGGDWTTLARKFSLPLVFTYEGVHRLQERLYNVANVDGQPGVFGGCRPRYDSGKRVVGWERKEGDEVHRVFEELGVDTWPIFGPTEEKLNDRKDAVLAYFRDNPQGALIVGVNEDTKTGISFPVKAGTIANHYIVVIRREGVYLSLDSFAQPGANALHRMTDDDVRQLVFESPITMLATKLVK